jgi:hypothetical protein
MALSIKDREVLEAYHDGALDAAGEEELRQRLKDDSDFRQAVEKWEAIWIVGTQPTQAEREERIRQKAFLNELEQQLPPVLPPPSPRRRWLWLLLLISVPLLVWWIMSRGQENNNLPSNESDTIEENISLPQFQAFDDRFFDHLPRESANLGSATDEALAHYDAQDYSTAWPLLAAQVTAKDSLLLLYAGVAALGDQHPENAIGFLEPLASSPTFVFYQEEVQWFLALAYLESGDREKAAAILASLAGKEGVYQALARILLDEI